MIKVIWDIFQKKEKHLLPIIADKIFFLNMQH